MSASRTGIRNLVVALLMAAVPSCGGGGGNGGGGGGPDPVPSPTPPPTTTLPPSGGKPTLKFSVNRLAGKSPLRPTFDLCQSVDASGGKALTYLASFEGEGLTDQGSCQFTTHVYRCPGVCLYDTRLAVRAAGGQQDEATVTLKAYVDVSVTVNPTSCDKISAIADLVSASSFDLRALADVDRVEFEALDAAGRSVSKKNGSKQSSSRWVSGDWSTTNNNKLRVRATVFANGIAGDDVPEQPRPGCP